MTNTLNPLINEQMGGGVVSVKANCPVTGVGVEFPKM